MANGNNWLIGGLILLMIFTLLSSLANTGMLGFLVNKESDKCPDCVCAPLKNGPISAKSSMGSCVEFCRESTAPSICNGHPVPDCSFCNCQGQSCSCSSPGGVLCSGISFQDCLDGCQKCQNPPDLISSNRCFNLGNKTCDSFGF